MTTRVAIKNCSSNTGYDQHTVEVTKAFKSTDKYKHVVILKPGEETDMVVSDDCSIFVSELPMPDKHM